MAQICSQGYVLRHFKLQLPHPQDNFSHLQLELSLLCMELHVLVHIVKPVKKRKTKHLGWSLSVNNLPSSQYNPLTKYLEPSR